MEQGSRRNAKHHHPRIDLLFRRELKSIDFKGRKMKFAGKPDSTFLNEALAVLDACIHPRPTYAAFLQNA